MDYHREYEVRAGHEPKGGSLYNWALREYSKDGTVIGDPQIPWRWSLHFTATELSHSYSIARNTDKNGTGGSLAEGDVIEAKLQPGRGAKDSWRDRFSLSLFGTDRKLTDISLMIVSVPEDRKEECHAWGALSFTAEWDFEDVIHPDMMQITLSVHPQRFNVIRDAMSDPQLDRVHLTLSGVDGFYSDWSPSIRTNAIKVLPKEDQPPLVREEGFDFEPPRLGSIDRFTFGFVRRKSIGTNEAAPEQDEDESEKPSKPSMADVMAAQLRDSAAAYRAATEASIGKLLVPLWVVAALLAAMIIF